ncbi:MAG: GNAT family N-acetyltransferase [Balneolia bacterium]|nr:GNAT family N-acetyltransferase [Balneolia bacterium]
MSTIEQLDVKIFRDNNSLKQLKMDWEALAGESGQTMFMSYSWVNNWWEVFGNNPNRSLFVHTIQKNGELIAILPLFIGKTNILGIKAQQRIQLLGSGGNPNETLGFSDFYGISDFLDFIIKPGFEEIIADYFIEMLDNEEWSKYRFHFVNINEGNFIHNYLFPRFNNNSRNVEVNATDTCPYIDLSQDQNLSDFIKNKDSGSVRRRFRQCLKAQKPETDKGYKIVKVENREELEDALNRIISLHQNRWNAIGYTGVFFDKRFVEFFKRIVFDAFNNKTLWLKHAIDEGGICATRMLILYNGRYFDYISGFSDDAVSAKYRPGIGLLLDVIDDALKTGIKRVDLLRGEESYKFDFTDKTFSNYTAVISEHPQAKGVNKPLNKATKLLSFIYKHTRKEIQLMQVQYINKGLLKMPVSYVQFRTKRLREKAAES